MNAPRMVICSGWGWAAAVAAARMWGENEKASMRARRLFKPNIKADGAGRGGTISVLSIISSLISHTGINYMSQETQQENNYCCFMCVTNSCTPIRPQQRQHVTSVMCLKGFTSPGNTKTRRVWCFQVQHTHKLVRNWWEGQRSRWSPPSDTIKEIRLLFCSCFSEWTCAPRRPATRSPTMWSFRW